MRSSLFALITSENYILNSINKKAQLPQRNSASATHVSF